MRASSVRRRLSAAAAAVLGLSLVTGCAGSVYDLPLPGGPSTGDDPMTVHVRFRDVLDLVPNSLVKINDVSVGKVTGVDLKGYTADVTMKLPKDTDLPDNAEATIRQTSLLGEKFVSLAPPASGAEGRLQTGDTIPLSRSGRNPEVEEVLGALSLLLNGGGVAQLRMIAQELNNALGGREDEVRNTLEQLRQFTGQLDARKQDIVDAIESLNRLALAAKRQDSTIKLTLDELPSAIASINTQRADLVRTLRALDNLSDVGVRVIRETKQNTITTLQDLGPVLDKLADAGSAFPRSTQVVITYPFVDETVGRNPTVARNIHYGDYVNLNVNLDITSDFLSAGCKALFNAVGTVFRQAGLSGNALSTAVTGFITQFITGNGKGCDMFTGFTTQGLSQITSILNGLGLSTTQVTAVVNGITGLINAGSGALTGVGSQQSSQSELQQSAQALTAPRRSNGGGLLSGLTGGSSSSGRSGSSSSGSSSGAAGSGSGSGSSSGGLFGGFLGLNRAATGLDGAGLSRMGNGKTGDALNGPVGTADQIGYNSTLGALLLQGVGS